MHLANISLGCQGFRCSQVYCASCTRWSSGMGGSLGPVSRELLLAAKYYPLPQLIWLAVRVLRLKNHMNLTKIMWNYHHEWLQKTWWWVKLLKVVLFKQIQKSGFKLWFNISCWGAIVEGQLNVLFNCSSHFVLSYNDYYPNCKLLIQGSNKQVNARLLPSKRSKKQRLGIYVLSCNWCGPTYPRSS